VFAFEFRNHIHPSFTYSQWIRRIRAYIYKLMIETGVTPSHILILLDENLRELL